MIPYLNMPSEDRLEITKLRDKMPKMLKSIRWDKSKKFLWYTAQAIRKFLKLPSHKYNKTRYANNYVQEYNRDHNLLHEQKSDV